MTQELNERLASKAGWIPGQDYGLAPSYVNSIDAQMRDLDPLVEAKWGPFSERTEPWHQVNWFRVGLVSHYGSRFVYGEGPTRAAARAAAIDQALKEEGNDRCTGNHT